MAVCLLSGRKSKLVVRLQKAEGEFGSVRYGFPMALDGIRQLLGEIHDVSEFQCHFGTSFWEPASALLGFFKHILCPSGAFHHWSVMAGDCKCGQVLQAELAELKQRRQELREVASCLG